MKQKTALPTSRIEAFSDGVIAILITVMVFDLKVPASKEEAILMHEIIELLPRFASYLLSFLMLAVMWVSHHQLFHQIKKTDGKLLWLSIHLLFWMSLIPFATNLLGNYPFSIESSFVYSFVFFMNALAFTLLRDYVNHEKLLIETADLKSQMKIRRKNRIAMLIYLSAGLLALISVKISFVLFILVPAMYFIPERVRKD